MLTSGEFCDGFRSHVRIASRIVSYLHFPAGSVQHVAMAINQHRPLGWACPPARLPRGSWSSSSAAGRSTAPTAPATCSTCSPPASPSCCWWTCDTPAQTLSPRYTPKPLSGLGAPHMKMSFIFHPNHFITKTSTCFDDSNKNYAKHEVTPHRYILANWKFPANYYISVVSYLGPLLSHGWLNFSNSTFTFWLSLNSST